MFLNCSQILLGEIKPNQDKQVLATESKVLARDHVTSKANATANKDETASDINSRPKLVMDDKKALGNPGWPTKVDNSLAPNQMKPIPPPAPTSSSKL